MSKKKDELYIWLNKLYVRFCAKLLDSLNYQANNIKGKHNRFLNGLDVIFALAFCVLSIVNVSFAKYSVLFNVLSVLSVFKLLIKHCRTFINETKKVKAGDTKIRRINPFALVQISLNIVFIILIFIGVICGASFYFLIQIAFSLSMLCVFVDSIVTAIIDCFSAEIIKNNEE